MLEYTVHSTVVNIETLSINFAIADRNMNSKGYRWCAVPLCINTSIKTPKKLFIFVPFDKTIRNKWLKSARRDLKAISPKTQLYICEDHFDLPNDMENYMEYHVMGSVSQIRMKRGCVPLKFQCQADKRKRISEPNEKEYINNTRKKMYQRKHWERETSEVDLGVDIVTIKAEDAESLSTNYSSEQLNESSYILTDDSSTVKTDELKPPENIELKDDNDHIGKKFEVDAPETKIKTELLEDIMDKNPKTKNYSIEPMLTRNKRKLNNKTRNLCNQRNNSSNKSHLTSRSKQHLVVKSYACDDCGYKTNKKQNIARHCIQHVNKKTYACNQCNYKCLRKSSLVIHFRQHTGDKPYTCTHCDYKSSCQSSLIRHNRQHTGEKPYSCNYCDYKTIQKAQLLVHSSQHTGAKPYACRKCDYRSISKGNLFSHIRQHTGEKPYACGLCDYRTNRKPNLNRHKRQHTSEKPYACEHCKFRSSNASSLNRHSKKHKVK